MEIIWERALTKAELQMEYLIRNKQELLCYVLSLTSLKKLEDHHFQNSLKILYRKVPTLQLGITSRNDDLWFYKRKEESIDLEMNNIGNRESKIRELLTYTYKTEENPLWAIRVLTTEPTTQDNYNYDLLLGFHHSIHDGYSNAHTCKLLLQLLNNELDGKISDIEILGMHASEIQTQVIMKSIFSDISDKVEEGLSFTDILKVKPVKIVQLFEPPINVKMDTDYIKTVIKSKDTLKFISLCKLNSVSFHSAFCTVINIAISHFILKLNADNDLYEIPSLHVMNLRRYWKPDTEIKLGEHANPMPITAIIHRNSMNDVWHCAKEFHKQFTNLIDEKTVFKFDAYCQIINRKKCDEFPNYYLTSNMGCLDDYLGLNFPSVNVDNIERHSSCTSLDKYVHLMQTLKSNFCHILQFNTKLMAEESAKLYNDMIFKVFNSSLARNNT